MRKITRDISRYLGANFIVQIFSVLRGAIVAGLLGPPFYGLWNALRLILDYSPYAGLGASLAMDREYPYCIGRKELTRAEEIKDTAFTFNLIISAILGLVLFIVALFLRTKVSREATIGLLIISFVLILQQINIFYRELARLQKRIDHVNVMLLLFSGINCFLAILLVRQFGISGMFFALVVAYLTALSYIIYKTKDRFSFRLNQARLKPLVKLGLALMMIPLLTTALQSVDRLMVLRFLGLTALGLYGFASLFAGLLFYLPVAYQFITYPYLLEGHGQQNNPRHLANLYVAQPTAILSGVLAFLIGIALILAGPAIGYLIPKYSKAIVVIKILLVSGFFFSLIYLPVNFLVALNKQARVIKIQLICLLLGIGLNYAFIKSGLSIGGVACARFIVHFFFANWILGVVLLHQLKNASRVFSYLIQVYISLGYTLLLVFVIEGNFLKCLIPFSNIWLSTLIKLMLFSLAGLPVLYYFNRRLYYRFSAAK
ncbi:oligosaccharide flippase family protein [Candidatus Omnitrophota bacterium]